MHTPLTVHVSHQNMPDFESAENVFDEIRKRDPFRIDDIDVLSNILYVMEKKTKLSKLAHEFLALDKDHPEICCIVGKSTYTSSGPFAV
jgi:anaphase-promoting complex subunit 8